MTDRTAETSPLVLARVAGALLGSAWLDGKDDSVDIERQAKRTAVRAKAWLDQRRDALAGAPLDFDMPQPEPLDFGDDDGRG